MTQRMKEEKFQNMGFQPCGLRIYKSREKTTCQTTMTPYEMPLTCSIEMPSIQKELERLKYLHLADSLTTSCFREISNLREEVNSLKRINRLQAETINRLENTRHHLDFENTCLMSRYLMMKSTYENSRN